MRIPTTAAWFGSRGVLVFATLFGVSCTAEIVASDPTDQDVVDDEPTTARRAFDATVAAKLDARCRFCHGDPAMAPAFLLGVPTVYDTVMAWPSLVDLDAPEQSRLLTKGDHDGPSWTDEEAAAVRAWIVLEQQAALGLDGAPSVTTVTPIAEGDNAIDLALVGLPGTTVTFVAAFSDEGLDLDLLEVHAGPDGAHVVDPSFVPYRDGGPLETLARELDGVDVAVAPHEESALGDGALSLAGLEGGTSLALRFALVEPAPGAAPRPAPDGDPCGRIDGFATFVRPLLVQHCQSCHAGADAPATAALDLSGLGDESAAARTAACGRMRDSLDLDRPMHSTLFTEVDPLLDAEHPFRFNGDYDAFRDFRTPILQWILGREAAP